MLWYAYVCALCAGQWIGEGTKDVSRSWDSLLCPPPTPGERTGARWICQAGQQGLEHLGRPGHEIQREVLCAVPASGFGNMGFLLEPWFMDHCSKNLTLPSLWDGHVVHIAISYSYGIMAPIKGSGGLGSGGAHL